MLFKNQTRSPNFVTELTHENSVGENGEFIDNICAHYLWKDFMLIQNPGNATLDELFWHDFHSRCSQLSQLHWTLAEALDKVGISKKM